MEKKSGGGGELSLVDERSHFNSSISTLYLDGFGM